MPNPAVIPLENFTTEPALPATASSWWLADIVLAPYRVLKSGVTYIKDLLAIAKEDEGWTGYFNVIGAGVSLALTVTSLPLIIAGKLKNNLPVFGDGSGPFQETGWNITFYALAAVFITRMCTAMVRRFPGIYLDAYASWFNGKLNNFKALLTCFSIISPALMLHYVILPGEDAHVYILEDAAVLPRPVEIAVTLWTTLHVTCALLERSLKLVDLALINMTPRAFWRWWNNASIDHKKDYLEKFNALFSKSGWGESIGLALGIVGGNILAAILWSNGYFERHADTFGLNALGRTDKFSHEALGLLWLGMHFVGMTTGLRMGQTAELFIKKIPDDSPDYYRNWGSRVAVLLLALPSMLMFFLATNHSEGNMGEAVSHTNNTSTALSFIGFFGLYLNFAYPWGLRFLQPADKMRKLKERRMITPHEGQTQEETHAAAIDNLNTTQSHAQNGLFFSYDPRSADEMLNEVPVLHGENPTPHPLNHVM